MSVIRHFRIISPASITQAVNPDQAHQIAPGENTEAACALIASGGWVQPGATDLPMMFGDGDRGGDGGGGSFPGVLQ